MISQRGFWKLKHAIWYLMACSLYNPLVYRNLNVAQACTLMDSLYG